MAITRIIDHHQDRRGGWSIQNGRNYQVQVRVYCDTMMDGPKAILDALVAEGITYGTTYRFPVDPNKPAAETDPGSFITSMAVDEQGNDGVNSYWLATLNYEPYNATEQAGLNPDGTSNPLNVPPDITWSFNKYQKGQVQDVSEPPKPYLNKAGDPLIDVPPADNSRPVLTYVRNELNYSVGLVTLYQDKINLLPWNGFAPKTVKIQQISGKKVFATDPIPGATVPWYWTVTYEFEVNPDTWTLKLGNVGLTELIDTTQSPANPKNHMPILVNKVPASTPQPLNLAGKYAPNSIHLLDFEQYQAVDFTPLNITGITS